MTPRVVPFFDPRAIYEQLKGKGIASPPGGLAFRRIMTVRTIFVECILFQWFLARTFLKFFLTNHDGLDNLVRRLPQEHFCRIILKSVQWFLTRRLFSFILLLVAMATRILLRFQCFEQLSASTPQGSFLLSLVQIGPVV